MKKMRIIFISIVLALLSFQSFSKDGWRQKNSAFDDESENKWEEVRKKGSGKITIYYYPDNSETDNSRDIIDGFEKDLVFSFKSYLEEKYHVELEVIWENVGDFNQVLSKAKSGGNGDFGISTISITEERAQALKFTPPYLADVQVIVSNHAFKLADTPEHLGELLNGKTAISIPNTTLERALLDLKSDLGIDFTIQYVSNTGELIEAIATNSSAFGYVDLVNFLFSFKNLAQLKRQLFFPVKLDGIGMIYPTHSDWDMVTLDYFKSQRFEKDKERITKKYFGDDIGSAMNQIIKSSEYGFYEEIVISSREKEIQYQEILKTLKREREEDEFNNALLIVLGLVALGGAILLVSNRIKSQVNKVLLEQQAIIEQRNEELKLINEEKNDLINVLAHDLRSPLNNIKGCTMLLQEKYELSEEVKKMMHFITDSSTRIQDMIAKILDVEAIDSQENNMQLETLCPDEIVKEIIKENSPKAQKKNIKLVFETQGNLHVQADRFYLAQVIENLLSNAIKFSEKNTQVTISVFRKKDLIRIRVKDFGPGMTKDDKKKVFKKFQRLSSKPTDGEESIGLGLSIVKKYAEMMGGKASFKSKLGKGSEFYIDLKAIR